MANALNIDQQSDRALKKYDSFKLDFSTSFSFSNETESIWLLIKKRIRSTNLRIRFFLVSMSCFIENCAFKKYSDTFTNDKKEMANALHRPAEWPGTQKVWPVQVGLLHKLQF